jgi:hypothetical protein
MPPQQLWLVLAIAAVLLFVLLRRRGLAQKPSSAAPPGDAAAPSPNLAWRRVARTLAQELGLQHVAQQRLPDRVEGSFGPLKVRLTGTRTRVAREEAKWPVFALRAEGVEGEAPAVEDAGFARDVVVRGLGAVHLAALREEATRAVVRRALHLGVVCGDDALAFHHEAPPVEADSVREVLTAMLDLAAWLDAPNAPAGRGSWRPSPLANLAQRDAIARRAGLREWLEQVGARLGPGKLAEKQEALEWRATLGEHPFRVGIDELEHLQLELLRAAPWCELVLWNDPSAIPSADADSAWDESDQVTVFVERGAYFDGEVAEVEQELRAWESLPEDLRGAIVTGLREVGARSVVVEGRTVRLDWHASPTELSDPDGAVDAGVKLMNRLGAELPRTGDQAVSGEAPGWTRSACRFCRTVFVWTTQSACPNCGGMVRA